MSKFRYMGHAMPYLPSDGCSGKLIVIEGHRRLRAKHAGDSAEGMARGAGICRHRHGLDAQQTRRSGDHRRQAGAFAASTDVLPDVCDRSGGSNGIPDYPGAAQRVHRLGGSIHLHAFGPRHRPRGGQAMAARSVWIRGAAGLGFLSSAWASTSWCRAFWKRGR